MEEELDIEQKKIKLKEQIETLKLQLELIARRSGKKEIETLKLKIELTARRSGRPRIDKGQIILKNRLAKLNSEYIHLISRKYIEGEDELW